MFRTQLPRLYELRDLIGDPMSPNAYFRDFEDHLRSSPHHVLPNYLRWEKQLQGLDSNAWKFLKSEVRPYLLCDKKSGRGHQQLFDFLNQARAYNYLKSIGCSNIHFIPRAMKEGHRTPDLEAVSRHRFEHPSLLFGSPALALTSDID